MNALESVVAERKRQDEKWGIQNHHFGVWLTILGEEFGEACKAALEFDGPRYRCELVQTAAVACAAIEAYDRGIAGAERAAAA